MERGEKREDGRGSFPVLSSPETTGFLHKVENVLEMSLK